MKSADGAIDGFFSVDDGSAEDVEKGDVITVSEINEDKGILKGVQRGGKAQGASGGGGGSDPLTFWVSYAKDLVVAGFSPDDALKAVTALREAFGTDRSGAMYAAYAKDLMVEGTKPTDAVSIIEKLREGLAEDYDPFEGE